MAVRVRVVWGLVGGFCAALVLSMLATLVGAIGRHPECATIPVDVGPCDYWGRVGEYAGFVILYGTAIGTVILWVLWLLFVAVVQIASRVRGR
ncbi:hypothetical protein [Nocardia sp. NPDC049149]|uniref:hypothetical protein n=1 Tax=Nocardia sp. NPDC049149 TaxID=3364315 RepID=UPI003712231B